MMSLKKPPNICIVGPMVGYNPGFPTTQGETLAKLLRDDGYPVYEVSKSPNRYVRVADIFSTLWTRRNWIQIQILQVFGHRSFIVEDLASAIGKRFGQVIIMVLHGGDLPELAKRFPDWVRKVFRRADILVSPSSYLARELAWLGPFRIQIIPNMIEIEDYSYSNKGELKPRLLWMRSFYWYYNPTMAIKVFKRIYQEYPDAQLTMAGKDEGTRNATIIFAHKMGLKEYIDFPGFLDQEAKAHTGDLHDIYINTNMIENMPVTLIEMAAMGLPIVATDVGGIPDLITNNETGLLVPNNDDQSMADAVFTLLKNPNIAKHLSRNGRKMAEMFSWHNVGPQWKALLNELYDERRL